MDLLPFYVKLITYGVICPEEGVPVVESFLANLIQFDQQGRFSNASIILAICTSCGVEFAGLRSLNWQNEAAQYGLMIPRRDEWLRENQRLNLENVWNYYRFMFSRMVQVRLF